jgi:hypothetical protein
VKGQLTGMRGVYLVAAELSRLGFITSPTSRSALAADILKYANEPFQSKSNPMLDPLPFGGSDNASLCLTLTSTFC